jgi:hypothetical protein
MTGKRGRDRVGLATQAVQRGWLALAALEMARTSEDVDRARHGAQHELETALRHLYAKVPDPPAAPSVRGRAASMTIVDDPLPFDSPDYVMDESARNEVASWWDAQRDTRPGATCCGRPDCVAAGGRRFGCTC